jgi:hypothetical protein
MKAKRKRRATHLLQDREKPSLSTRDKSQKEEKSYSPTARQ